VLSSLGLSCSIRGAYPVADSCKKQSSDWPCIPPPKWPEGICLEMC